MTLGVMRDAINNLEWFPIVVGALIGYLLPKFFKIIWYIVKPSRKKYHLSLSQQSANKSYSSFSDKELSISVKYKGESYSGILSMVTIALVNDGQNDLSYVNHFDKPITLRSSGYRIIDVEVVGNEKIKAEAIINHKGMVEIKWGLLKEGEEIVIRLVGVCEDEKHAKSFFDSFTFNVRSDCVDYIVPQRTPFREVVLFSFLFVALSGCITFWALNNENVSNNLYSFALGDEIVTGTLDYNPAEGVYHLYPRDSVIVATKGIDFSRHPKVTVSNSWNTFTFTVVFHLGLWVVFLLVYYVIDSVENRKKKVVFEDAEES